MQKEKFNLIAYEFHKFINYNEKEEKMRQQLIGEEFKRMPKFISNLSCDKLSVDNCIFENADFTEGIFKEICEKSLNKKLDDNEISENNNEMLTNKHYNHNYNKNKHEDINKDKVKVKDEIKTEDFDTNKRINDYDSSKKDYVYYEYDSLEILEVYKDKEYNNRNGKVLDKDKSSKKLKKVSFE